jgi:uncharacterized ubiquitin-like protein YukD
MKILRKYILALFFLLVGVSCLHGQDVRKADMAGDEVYLLNIRVIDGDTLPHVNLAGITVVPEWKFKSNRQKRVYNRMVRNIKVTLPYARLAARKLQDINVELTKIEDEEERKKYLKVAEKKLFHDFEQPLRKLTFSQGRMLIKLIDRETGDTSYNLVKDYKGGFSAFFWQSVARLFGSNLKDEFDADEEDRMIEYIIIMIDSGRL